MSFPRLSRTFFFVGDKAILGAFKLLGVDAPELIMGEAAPIRSKGACPDALLGW